MKKSNTSKPCICRNCKVEYDKKEVERSLGKQSAPAVYGYCSAFCYTRHMALGGEKISKSKSPEFRWSNVKIKNLKTGDIIRNVGGTISYVVTVNYGNRVTAVQTADVANESEWMVLSPSK